MSLATDLHLSKLVTQGRLPQTDPSKDNELINDIPGVPPMRMVHLPSGVRDHSAYDYEFYLRNSAQIYEAAGVVINTFYELESVCVDALRKTVYGSDEIEQGHQFRLLPVGPMLPLAYFISSSSASNHYTGRPVQCETMIKGAAMAADHHPCLQWLEKQPPASVLYVSFGSVAALPIPQIHELAMGLQEASGQRFLLVIRSPNAASDHHHHRHMQIKKSTDAAADLMMINGMQQQQQLLPQGFTAHMEARGFVQEDWAPQLHILSHPAVEGFLTHCGWNSTLESICRGVPMLAWPIQTEQHLNCRYLVDDVKVAIEVQRGSKGAVTKAEVTRAVKSLMSEAPGRVARNNVEKLRDLALNAVSKEGSVQQNCETFVQELQTLASTQVEKKHHQNENCK